MFFCPQLLGANSVLHLLYFIVYFFLYLIVGIFVTFFGVNLKNWNASLLGK